MASSANLASPSVVVEVRNRVRETPAVKRSGILRDWLEQRIQKGKTRVFSERISVTPELAQMILERNKDNRKIRPAKLAQLKSDMNANRFLMNGESIIISKTGELNDGQHRLQAIVETNKPQDMLITFGVTRESRLTVDTGANRSAGDHLTISGWPYATALATIARTLIGYERNKGETLGSMSDISSAAVYERSVKDELLKEIAGHVGSNSNKYTKLGKLGLLGAAFYLFAQKRPNEARTFMDKLRTGVDLGENDPIRLYREYVLARPRLTANQKFELILRAWNAWIKDVNPKQLRLVGKLPTIEG